jgi:hypothetical protein
MQQVTLVDLQPAVEHVDALALDGWQRLGMGDQLGHLAGREHAPNDQVAVGAEARIRLDGHGPRDGG